METLSGIVALALGLILGSFSTALAHRAPRGRTWQEKLGFSDIGSKENGRASRSRCVACEAQLKAIDLVPVLSWLFLKGRCRYCETKISWRYPAMEAACAILCLLIFLRHGWGVESVLMMMSVPVLLALFAVDWEHLILPNILVLAFAVLGFTRLVWLMASAGGTDDALRPLVDFGLGAVFYGLLAFLAGALTSWWVKKPALGMGDVKYFAAAGLWLGIWKLSAYLMLSGLGGLLMALVWRKARGNGVFPFGPALIMATLALFLWDGSLLPPIALK